MSNQENEIDPLTLSEFADLCRSAGVRKIKIRPEGGFVRIDLTGRIDGKSVISSACGIAGRYLDAAALQALTVFQMGGDPPDPPDVPAPAPTPVTYRAPTPEDAAANAEAIGRALCTCVVLDGLDAPHPCPVHGWAQSR